MNDAVAVEYRILGPLTVEDGGSPLPLGGPKQRLVLALLLVEPDRVVHLERLIDGVWEGGPPSGAAHNIQGYISELRRVLPDAITFGSGGYRLHIDPTRIDSRRFESLLESGRGDGAERPETAASALRDALALWRGAPFADLRYVDALQAEIGRLEAMRLSALELRLEADLALGRHRQLVDELEALTREHPFHERFWGDLMLALHRSGRRAEALGAFERARRALAEELGVEPSPGLVDLRRRVSDADPSLLVAGLATRDVGPASPSVRGFELRGRIGAGRVGEVYAAYQASLGREVAVKVLGPDIADRPSFVRRFREVTRRVARLEHPNIIPLLDAWRDPGGAYLVTPLLSGGDLESSLADGAWQLPAALRLVDQVGSALAHAHRSGIAHGDLDASDVLLDAEGNAFLGDLGLHECIGQRPGRNGGGAGSSTGPDLARLGLLTYRLLTGLPVRQDLDGDVSVLRPEVPREVDRLLRQVVSLQTGEGPASIDDFLCDLRRAFGVDGVGVAFDEAGDEVRDPYKGLRAFETADVADFFGREAAVEVALERLHERRLVAVVGSSGSGKSSLVRAGLVPALHEGALPGSNEWLVSTMAPGPFPVEELARVVREVSVTDDDAIVDDLADSDEGLIRVVDRLLPPDVELVLVVDQLEELFSMVDDPKARGRFLASLARAAAHPASRVRVVVTARADFFDRFVDDPAFGNAMRDGLVPLPPPSPAELMRAITAPARRAGLRFEGGLAERIVEDVSGRPGALPLMQHALTELVRGRSGRTLTLEAYEAAGGALGALGNRAEQVYASLDDEARATVRDVLMRLTAIDDGGVPVRRRVTLAELVDLGLERRDLDRILGAFGTYRLLTFDRDPVSRGPTVEVAHEALFSQWSRLAGWVDTHRDGLVLQRRLALAAADWREAGQDPSYTLSGGRLVEFEQWAAHTDVPLSVDERTYLEMSRAREDMAARSAARRRWLVLGSSTLLMIMALVLGTVSYVASMMADQERTTAQVRELIARSERVADDDPDLSILLAGEAVERARASQGGLLDMATGQLHASIIRSRLYRTYQGYGEVAWSPDGAYIAFADDFGDEADPGGIRVVDVRTGESVRFLPSPDGTKPHDLGWSPDGRNVVVTYIVYDPDAADPWNPPDAVPAHPVIWDARTGARVATLPASDGAAFQGPAFSPDGALLAASRLPPAPDLAGALTVWERAREGSTAGTIAAVPSGGASEWRLNYEITLDSPGLPAFTPSGSVLAVGGEDGMVLLVEPATGKLLSTLGPVAGGGGVVDIAWSPGGAMLAALSWNGRVTLLRSDGVTEPTSFGPNGQQRELAWSPLGDRIAVAGNSGAVTLWDPGQAEQVGVLRGHAGTITGLAWAADGSLLASAGAEGPVRVWKPYSEGREVATFGSGGVPMARARWATNERIVIGHGLDGRIRAWTADGGSPIATLTDEQEVGPFSVSMSPDGVHAAVTGSGWSTVLVEADTLREVWRRADGGVPASFSSDGQYLATGHHGVARILDAATGEVVAEYVVPEDEPSSFFFQTEFLAGDRWVLLVDPASGPRMWDWQTDTLHGLDYRIGDRVAAVSTDRTRFAIGGDEMEGARVWDAAAFLSGEAAEPTVIQPDLPLVAEAIVQAFTPDGRQLLSGYLDRQITFWDLDSGEPVRIVPTGGVVSTAQVSQDGRYLLVGSNPTRTFALETDELLDIARHRATRSLTTDECREYLHVDACPAVPDQTSEDTADLSIF